MPTLSRESPDNPTDPRNRRIAIIVVNDFSGLNYLDKNVVLKEEDIANRKRRLQPPDQQSPPGDKNEADATNEWTAAGGDYRTGIVTPISSDYWYLVNQNTLGAIRTRDLGFRKPLLYPSELRGQVSADRPPGA